MTKSIFLPSYFEIQSTLLIVRELFVGASFDLTSRLYVKVKQGTPWNLSTRQLLDFPEDSLGFHLGCFLLQHNFEPQPKCEDHDIFHVLTGYKTDTAQEIALQFFLYGNGKRSPFLSLAMGVGYLLYPDQYATFKVTKEQGRLAPPVYDLDFKALLHKPFKQLKSQFIN